MRCKESELREAVRSETEEALCGLLEPNSPSLQSLLDETIGGVLLRLKEAGVAAEKKSATDLAVFFHEAYEHLAPEFGYETRPDTRVFDTSSPNGKLMIAVCEELIREFEVKM